MTKKAQSAERYSTPLEEKLLEKDPTQKEGKRLRETADNAFAHFVRGNKYRLHDENFEKERREALAIGIKGFTNSERIAKVEELNAKREEYRAAFRKLKELKDHHASDREIAEQEGKLDTLIQEVRQKADNTEALPQDPILDDDEIRVMVGRIVPPQLRGFMEQHCRIEYDPDAKNDQIVVSEEDKIVFKFGPSLLRYEQQGNKKVPRVDKVMFQLARMVGALIQQPKAWDQYKNKIKILEQKAPSWEDYVALYLTDPTDAQRIAPEAFQAAKKALDGIKMAGDAGDKNFGSYINKTNRTQTFESNFEYAHSTPGLYGRALMFFENARNLKEQFGDRLYASLRELVPYKQSDWYERTLVEFEDKEVSRILARDEHVTDRHKRLKTFYENGDEFGARTLIKSMTHTGDSRWWVYHSFLMRFDPLYRKTNGEEITRENYSFIVQNLRISHVGKRHGTKPAEYAPITSIPGARMRIRRISRERWEHATEEEIDKKSMRDLLAVAQEAYEWMETTGADGKPRHFQIDEMFGDPNYVPFGLENNWNKDRDPWQEETNNMMNLLDQNFVKEIARHANYRRNQTGDLNQGWSKLDPDQMMMVARIIGVREVFEENPGKKVARDPFDSEHFKLAQKRAVGHYREMVKQYKERLAKGGEHIAAYDRFIYYIDRFKEKELDVVRMMSEGDDLSKEELRAEEIVNNEPIISFQDDDQDISEKISKVESADKSLEEKILGGKADKDGKREGGIAGLSLNSEKVREQLKKNPEAIIEFLDDYGDPDSLSEYTDTIYGLTAMRQAALGDPEKEAAYQEVHDKQYQKMYRDFATVRDFYVKKRELFDAYHEIHGWISDVKPFKKSLESTRFQEAVAEEKRLRGQEFSNKLIDLVANTEYQHAVQNHDWDTIKQLLESDTYLGRKIDKKEADALSKMGDKFEKQVSKIFGYEGRKGAERKVLEKERGLVKEELNKFILSKIREGAIPEYHYQYLESPEATPVRSITQDAYNAVKGKFSFLSQEEGVTEPDGTVGEDDLTNTALWQTAASKRERTVVMVRMGPTPADRMPFIISHLPEYTMGNNNRPQWLYEQLKLYDALLKQKIDSSKDKEPLLEEEKQEEKKEGGR